jgi:acyl-CoA thioesterase-1
MMASLLTLSLFVSSAPPKHTLVVALGDSLTEGFGVAQSNAYPALLERKLVQSGLKIKIQNAGISGSTSASAPLRMKWILKSKPNVVILALGSNDGLRGLPVAEMEKNLSEAIQLAQKEKVKVLLCGALLPTNYGKEYTSSFAKVFERLAKKYAVTFMPFLLDGVALDKNLNQTDGLHPNEKGHAIMAAKMEPYLRKLL